jgi:hypothetical protein
MPAQPRRNLVDEGEVGFYHCVARCVRRAFLCGSDPASGQDFNHRKNWIRDRLEELAALFAIEVTSFALLSNHLHVIVRIRPDLAGGWTPEEIARRWRAIFSKQPPVSAGDVTPTDALTATWRSRLSSLSWFMRCLCEPIARRSNREDGCSGRFWKYRSYYLHSHCSTIWKNAGVLWRSQSNARVRLGLAA